MNPFVTNVFKIRHEILKTENVEDGRLSQKVALRYQLVLSYVN